jgi:hypothetical protein
MSDPAGGYTTASDMGRCLSRLTREQRLNSLQHTPQDTDITSRMTEFEITDDLQDLLAVLPPHIADQIVALQRQEDLGGLIEIVLDLGRSP